MHAYRQPVQLLKLTVACERDYLQDLDRMLDLEESQGYAGQHDIARLWPGPHRNVMVDWIFRHEENRWTREASHMAVFYLDKVNSVFSLTPDELVLVALACIQIACTMEEREENFPSLKELAGLAENYSGDYVKKIFNAEKEILGFLHWKTRIVTALNFAHCFLQIALDPETDSILGNRIKGSETKTMKYLEKYAEFYADYCIQHAVFCKYDRSRLAAAQIYCARMAMKIMPTWNRKLSRYTTYDWSEIEEPANHLWQAYCTDFPFHVSGQKELIKINT